MTTLHILRSIHDSWLAAREAVHSKWNRSLPFGEYVVDRWEKAKLLGFGDGTSIYDSAVVLGNVSVGDNTWIGPWVMLDGSAGLKIGSDCSISAGVQIYTHDSVKWAISGGTQQLETSPTIVGNRCYIGPNVIISKGITIGDSCIIGANSLVLTDVPSRAKALGTPCRVVGTID